MQMSCSEMIYLLEDFFFFGFLLCVFFVLFFFCFQYYDVRDIVECRTLYDNINEAYGLFFLNLAILKRKTEMEKKKKKKKRTKRRSVPS